MSSEKQPQRSGPSDHEANAPNNPSLSTPTQPAEVGDAGDDTNHVAANDLRPSRTTELRDLIGAEKKKLTNKKEKIKTKAKPPGGFDRTPFPDAPPGYTVKFTFHKATNLPVADIKTSAADPFLHATLTAPVPQRHKEDPVLTLRTPTIKKTTEPVWDQEWIVANVPPSGFTLKCRLYDEDWPDHDDRLGNVTIRVTSLDENWEGLGPGGKVFEVKKRSGSKRAYLLRGLATAFCKNVSMTPRLHVSIEVLGKSDPPYAQMYTVGPTYWVKHYSPMIGRLIGTKVNQDEENDADSTSRNSEDRQTKKYDFQANEIQLSGPVPEKLYHRYVEFRPIISSMFASTGLRGRILNMALHKQHARVYNFDSTTEHGNFPPRTEQASLQFLKMAHFDEGARMFTYVITLDAMLRFTETGKEFGVDLLSKHTMHSDVATYIACSGEFFIRRLAHPDARHASKGNTPNPGEPAHPPGEEVSGGPPNDPPPRDPRHYQLIIDNDSGTYRPDKSILPDLKRFLEDNFPGLGIVVMACDDEKLIELKKVQAEAKKREGGARLRMVLNRSPSGSSFSSDDESRLGDMERAGEAGVKSKKERAFDVLQDPSKLKNYVPHGHHGHSEPKAEVTNGEGSGSGSHA
ncbi:hypothetical protein B0T25DRAFT_459984 [Lasiosphaeria hispida]|uniref:C2 domain-containing protein n=1 Tax=Lasiosphaeria hispida TaxID=260671 RepID=A0AAJ0HAS1_9PEZI|nr:hypothetical protein B0T25DRAFT_459984 [Lasiosphaeria hispida]